MIDELFSFVADVRHIGSYEKILNQEGKRRAFLMNGYAVISYLREGTKKNKISFEAFSKLLKNLPRSALNLQPMKAVEGTQSSGTTAICCGAPLQQANRVDTRF